MENNGIVQILDGAAQILSGVAEALRGATGGADRALSDYIAPAAAPRPFDGAAERGFDEAVGKTPPPLGDDPFTGVPVKAGLGDVAEIVADDSPGRVALPCEEVTRQEKDPTRRDAIASDPVEWMAQAAYYCGLIAEAHNHTMGIERRVEDLVRCLEALPGHADKRIFDLATADVQVEIDAYIGFWVQAYGAVKINVETGRLDADHQTRLLYRLGGEPNFYNTEDEEAA